MKILAIDTSNEVLGVSLLSDEEVIGEYITNMKRNHSVRVMPAIEKLMADCEMTPKDLTRIVVAKGPGSYTGVRIGVTIAKTLAWSLQIPLVAVSSLAVLAANGLNFKGYVSPLFDARRGLIYTGLYEFVKSELRNVVEDQNILASEWAEQIAQLDKPILFIGNDVELHEETFTRILENKAVFTDLPLRNPRPSVLGQLGMKEKAVDVHTFTPNYARLVEAEAKWLEKQERLK